MLIIQSFSELHVNDLPCILLQLAVRWINVLASGDQPSCLQRTDQRAGGDRLVAGGDGAGGSSWRL